MPVSFHTLISLLRVKVLGVFSVFTSSSYSSSVQDTMLKRNPHDCSTGLSVMQEQLERVLLASTCGALLSKGVSPLLSSDIDCFSIRYLSPPSAILAVDTYPLVSKILWTCACMLLVVSMLHTLYLHRARRTLFMTSFALVHKVSWMCSLLSVGVIVCVDYVFPLVLPPSSLYP